MTLHPPDDQDIIVVGASGDLSARKLLPALYNLERDRLLPAHGRVIGFAQDDWDDAAFRSHAHDAIAAHSRTGIEESTFSRFAARLRYIPTGRGFDALHEALEQPRRLAYLAVPASAFQPLVQDFGARGLADGTSIIIEKPFGHDRASAAELNRTLHDVLPEDRIFRIDHYLGKETVQNLLVFRFGNAIFERIWNRDCIERIEITVAEDLGVEGRGRFYEETGALRDIVQNHLFQLLTLTAMEPPTSFDAEALRNEKVKVLQAVHPVDLATVVRGQYGAGAVGGTHVPAYRSEPGVSSRSETETYVALCLEIDSWRWAGVHFLLRTGKRLPRRETSIVVTFRGVPLHLFGAGRRELDHNRLLIRVQPDEGIELAMTAKRPGPELTTATVDMDFRYGTSFKTSPPEAYERLLHDAFLGDHTLFIREDEVDRGWAVVEPILDNPPPIHLYRAGSWGPREADAVAAPGCFHEHDIPIHAQVPAGTARES